jgi:hypothetical protein
MCQERKIHLFQERTIRTFGVQAGKVAPMKAVTGRRRFPMQPRFASVFSYVAELSLFFAAAAALALGLLNLR